MYKSNVIPSPFPSHINLNAQLREITFNSLFHLFPINFTWFDHEGNILYCNQRVLDLFELKSINDALGKSAKDLTNATVWENTERTLKSGVPIMCEESHVTSKGDTIFFLSMKTPMINQNGKIMGLVNIAVDITDQKKLQIDLINARNAAKFSEWGTI